MAEISDTKLERLIDEFLTKMPGGLSARFISYYINWAGLLDENEWCDKKSVNSFFWRDSSKYEQHNGTSETGNNITYWTLKDEYKVSNPHFKWGFIWNPSGVLY